MPFGDDATPVAGPSKPGATPTPTDREAYLKKRTDSQLATMLKQNAVTEEELSRIMPERLASIKDNPVTPREMSTTYPSLPTPPPTATPTPPGAIAGAAAGAAGGAPGTFNQPTGTPQTIQERMQQARAVGEAPLVPTGPAAAPPAPAAGPMPLPGGKAATTSSSKGSTSKGGRGGGSGGGVGAAAARPPAINSGYFDAEGNEHPDFRRDPITGKLGVFYQGKVYPLPEGTAEDNPMVGALIQSVLAGNPLTSTELFQAGGGLMQKPGLGLQEGLQYQRDPNTGFYDKNGQPGITSNGMSSTANAIRDGLPKERVPGGMDLDQIIASTFTKGDQTGDIMGSANLGKDLGRWDVTRGNYSELGGLRDVSSAALPDGTPGQVKSYTGQLPGNISVGQGAPDANYLQQNGIPESVYAKLSPEQQRQMGHNVEMLRAQGNMPDLASLASQYDPKTSGMNLKIASSVETPYETALKKLLAQIDQPLEQMGLEQPEPPMPFAQGGNMTISEPSIIQGLMSGRNYGVMGAAPEKVSNITPLGTESEQRRAGGIESAIAQSLNGGMPMARGGVVTPGSPAPGTRPNDPEEVQAAAIRNNPLSTGFKYNSDMYSRLPDGTWVGPEGPMPRGWMPPPMVPHTPGSNNTGYIDASGWEGINQDVRGGGLPTAGLKSIYSGFDTNDTGIGLKFDVYGNMATAPDGTIYRKGPDGQWYADAKVPEPQRNWTNLGTTNREALNSSPVLGPLFNRLPGGNRPQQPQAPAPAPAPLPDFLQPRKENPRIFAEGGSFDWAPQPDGNDLAHAEGLQAHLAGQPVAPEWAAMMGLSPAIDPWENPQNALGNQFGEQFSTVSGNDMGQYGMPPSFGMMLQRLMDYKRGWGGSYSSPMQKMYDMGRFNPPAVNAEPPTFAQGGQVQSAPPMGGMPPPIMPPQPTQAPPPPSPMSNPLVLEQLAKGVRNRARLTLPSGML